MGHYSQNRQKELVEEIEETKPDILAITETKTK